MTGIKTFGSIDTPAAWERACQNARSEAEDADAGLKTLAAALQKPVLPYKFAADQFRRLQQHAHSAFDTVSLLKTQYASAVDLESPSVRTLLQGADAALEAAATSIETASSALTLYGIDNGRSFAGPRPQADR